MRKRVSLGVILLMVLLALPNAWHCSRTLYAIWRGTDVQVLRAKGPFGQPRVLPARALTADEKSALRNSVTHAVLVKAITPPFFTSIAVRITGIPSCLLTTLVEINFPYKDMPGVSATFFSGGSISVGDIWIYHGMNRRTAAIIQGLFPEDAELKKGCNESCG
jgi:hypothetical protein